MTANSVVVHTPLEVSIQGRRWVRSGSQIRTLPNGLASTSIHFPGLAKNQDMSIIYHDIIYGKIPRNTTHAVKKTPLPGTWFMATSPWDPLLRAYSTYYTASLACTTPSAHVQIRTLMDEGYNRLPFFGAKTRVSISAMSSKKFLDLMLIIYVIIINPLQNRVLLSLPQ